MKRSILTFAIACFLPVTLHAGSDLDAMIKDTSSGRHDPMSEDFIPASADIFRFDIAGNQDITIGNNGRIKLHDKGIDYNTGYSYLYNIFYPQTVYDEMYDEIYWRKALPLYRHAEIAGIRDKDAFVRWQIDMPPRPREPDIDRYPTEFTGIKRAQVICAATAERLSANGIAFKLVELTKVRLPCTRNPLEGK